MAEPIYATPLIAGDLLDRARRLADDMVKPYFTDDSLFYSFISDAERELASVARIIRETRNFPVASGDVWVDLNGTPETEHLEILELRAADLLDGSGRRHSLRLIGALDLVPETYADEPVTEAAPAASGRPSTLILGKRYNQFQVYPKPDAEYTIEAQLIVYPTTVVMSAADVLSIPQRYHSLIPVGAALRAVESYSSEEFNQSKLQGLSSAWKRALVRAASENSVISRDGGAVKFANDLWGGGSAG